MKLKEFKKIVDDCCEIDPEAAVVIPVFKKGVVGPHPIDLVQGAMLGFDWERGRFLIWPENNLQVVKSEEKEDDSH